MVPELDKPITGFSHAVDVLFASGNPVKIKALGLVYSQLSSVAKGQ